MRFVAFYWTYRDQGIRPEGLQNASKQVRRRKRIKAVGTKDVDAAAELSLTIGYMRAKARQITKEQGGSLVDEVAYEEPGDRPTEGVIGFLQRALRLCERKDASLLMPDPKGLGSWRPHGVVRKLVAATNLGIEVGYFNQSAVLIQHFRWHRAEEKKRLKNRKISRSVKRSIENGAEIKLGDAARAARKEQQLLRTINYYKSISGRVAGIKRELQKKGRRPTDAEMVAMLNHADIPPPVTAQSTKEPVRGEEPPKWTVASFRKARVRHGL